MEHSEKLLLRSSPSEDVTPEMGIILGQALAIYYDKVVVGRDMMQSSPMMKNAVVSGLVSSGADVIDIGVPAALDDFAATVEPLHTLDLSAPGRGNRPRRFGCGR